MNPYKTLRNLLVHSKDKHAVVQTGECMSHNCSSRLHTLEKQDAATVKDKEHRKEVESVSNRTLTRAERKELATETNESAMTDHVAKENHVIDWSGARILDRETHRKTRQLREFIHICREVNCVNRDRGACGLPVTYDRILLISNVT